MTLETKELRNQIVALRKSLNSAPKSEHSNIKNQIAELEQKVQELRKPSKNEGQEEPEVKIVPEEKKEFKPSKSMLKKQVQNAQMEAQRAAALQSLSTSSAKVIADAEEADLLGQFSLHQLALHQITPDGNCLFSAVKHQLDFLGLGKGEDLRALAVRHLRENAECYGAFMVEESLDSYCQRMERAGEWGGQLELVALSKALNVTIRVFQAHSEPLLFSPENETPTVLNISYHRHAYALGEHYNSLIKKLH